MAKLHYRVTVEFDADAENPTEVAEILTDLKTIGTVTKVNASKKGKEKV